MLFFKASIMIIDNSTVIKGYLETYTQNDFTSIYWPMMLRQFAFFVYLVIQWCSEIQWPHGVHFKYFINVYAFEMLIEINIGTKMVKNIQIWFKHLTCVVCESRVHSLPGSHFHHVIIKLKDNTQHAHWTLTCRISCVHRYHLIHVWSDNGLHSNAGRTDSLQQIWVNCILNPMT